MGKVKLLNGMPLGAVAGKSLMAREISLQEAQSILQRGFESYIGHTDTAVILSNLLHVNVPMNRATTALNQGDVIIVAAYEGPRLTEGSTVLPMGARFRFWRIEVE